MASTVTTMPTTVADSTGRQYRIADKLGKGGFAVCYRTEVNGQQLALKVSRTNEMAEKLRDKLITELQIHSKIRHANILQFHRAFSVHDNTYFALELCTNGTLKEMLANRGRISMPETRRFGLQLCGALHYLHMKRVIHRDIKTANILLDEHMNIKLADFGLAAVLVTDEEMGEVKRRVTVCGTPNYIAPEILHKKKGHDTKADIWSLGVLFYNMLTGSMPFSRPEDKGHEVVFKRVAEGSFNWPDHANKTLSPAALDLVDRMLQTVDVDRPEAIEVADHEFFKDGAIPIRLEASCVRTRPTWLKKTDPQDMRSNAKTISHESMLTACGLFDSTTSRPPLAEIAQEAEPPRTASPQTNVPLSHLLLHEFNQGLVPTLPLRGVYEPMEYSSSGSLKIKPRKQPKATNSTVMDKDASKASSRSTEPEPCPLSMPSEGLILEQPLIDVKTALNNVWNIIRGRPTEIRRIATGLPPIVVHSLETLKWGLGYVLVDGSIGLLSQRRAPEKALVINQAIQHFKIRKTSKAMLPTDSWIRFYERDPQASAVSDSSTSLSTPIKLFTDTTSEYPSIEVTVPATAWAPASVKHKLDVPPQDLYKMERGRALSLWARYATYLSDKVSLDDIDVDTVPISQDVYLSMWQLIGNVQAWHWIGTGASYEQGGYEFDFGDRTAIALSPDGTEARFSYEPETPPTRDGTKSQSRRLETIELPLTTLLSCSSTKNAVIWRVLEANHFKPKLDFVRDILLMWHTNKGVGKQGTQKMAYRGPRAGAAPHENDVEVLNYAELLL